MLWPRNSTDPWLLLSDWAGELGARSVKWRTSVCTSLGSMGWISWSMAERCARWLLMTHDRVGRATFTLTQQFLAQMLGVQRATVSLALRTLRRAGLISYMRGRFRIRDRAGLEAVSCSCYARITAAYQRMQADLTRP